jgi:hypothetical protein
VLELIAEAARAGADYGPVYLEIEDERAVVRPHLL